MMQLQFTQGSSGSHYDLFWMEGVSKNFPTFPCDFMVEGKICTDGQEAFHLFPLKNPKEASKEPKDSSKLTW